MGRARFVDYMGRFPGFWSVGAMRRGRRGGTLSGPITHVQRSLYLFDQFNIHRTYLNSSQKKIIIK